MDVFSSYRGQALCTCDWRIKCGFHGARERCAKDANVEKMAKPKISPNVSRRWSRKPFLRSLGEVLKTYVRMSCVPWLELRPVNIHDEQATYMQTTRMFQESGRNNRANFAAYARHSANCRDLIWGFAKTLRTSRTS